MKLHNNQTEFRDLVVITAKEKHIPEKGMTNKQVERKLKAKVFYEQLHKDLLYTDEKQHFETAFHAFDRINAILAEIGE